VRACVENGKVWLHLEARAELLNDQDLHPLPALDGNESALAPLLQSTEGDRSSGPVRSCGARTCLRERIAPGGLWIVESVCWSWSEVVGKTGEVRVEVDQCGNGRSLHEAKRPCGRCRLRGNGVQKVFQLI
jgi:hypothetical protein